MSDSDTASVSSTITPEEEEEDDNVDQEEEEQNVIVYDEITPVTGNSGATDSDYINKLYLEFSESHSPSEMITCKAFWQYLNSMPHLEPLRTLAWRDSAHSIDGFENTLPTAVVRRRWLCELLKMKCLNLDQLALAGCPEYRDPCAGVFADMSGQQVAADIEEFEEILRVRESQRDPNQRVLGYKMKQPPPMKK